MDIVSAIQLQNSTLNTKKKTSFHIPKVKPDPLEILRIVHMRKSNGVKYTDRRFNSGELRIILPAILIEMTTSHS